MIWRLPQKPSDLFGWGMVSFGAGTTEEIMFRGVMFQLWFRVLGAWWPATLLGAASFAFGHFLQGWRSMAIIFGMAIGMQGLVWATGDLYTVMAVHFVYDLVAGLIFLLLAKRDGLIQEDSTSPGEDDPSGG